jgi:hypothetical protein
VLGLAAALPLFAISQALDYGRDVRPILAENCFHCHGQDGKKRMANLRLDLYEGKLADPAKLLDRITTANKARRMPPEYSHRSLTDAQVDTLKRWVQQDGGAYAKHWAFLPPTKPASMPAGNPIDALVRTRLKSEGLNLRPAANPATWLRRVSLDLTGLPPTPAEIDAFVKDATRNQSAAYRKAVDRLLASPAYGERMAMDWLDVARYADTHGFNNDSERSMWRWRDWVIDAFNRNLPYDRFITEQLAGDLLPNPTLDQRIATGFGRNHVINSEGGIIDEEYRVEYVADRVRTLGMAWLGLTVECARCHDHKYDPFTQRDHYRLYAFFNNVPEIGEDGRVANAVPMIPAPTVEQQRQLRDLESAIAIQTKAVKRLEEGWTWTKPGLSSDFKAQPFAGGTTKVPIARRAPFTFSMWIEPTAADADHALLSTIDYTKNTAAVGYASGLELRLVQGEMEFRFSQRLTAYSCRVRSEGANLKAGERHHIVAVYTGVGEDKDAMRMKASWVRMYVDGREVATQVLNDGSGIPDAKSDKPSEMTFRVGRDNAPGSKPVAGKLEHVAIYNAQELKPADVESLFVRDAIPYVIARQSEGKATPVEVAWVRERDPKFKAARAKLEDLRSQWLKLRREAPTVMVMEELPQPRQTNILLRGAYNAPGEPVDAGVPEALLGVAWPAGAPRNRLGLAQWLTKPEHPLTSRVVVNRFWQQLFGTGLVKTSENFGLQGEFPSHPELLDWLARDFIDSGWNVKALLRNIVLSDTYRQDASAPADLIARDPENRLLARGPRFRLPAEILRDQALAVAGLLHTQIGGPSVFPYQPDDLYKGIVVAADYPGTKYITSKGTDLYRRSMYTYWKRTVPHPTMTVFDAPDREFCIVRRSTTNTPLQALTLLNDPIFVEAARKLAERAIRQGGTTPIAHAFQLATGRKPDAKELAILHKTLEEATTLYDRDTTAAEKMLTAGASPRDPAVPVAKLAAHTAVANVILNLDEVITKP